MYKISENFDNTFSIFQTIERNSFSFTFFNFLSLSEIEQKPHLETKSALGYGPVFWILFPGFFQ